MLRDERGFALATAMIVLLVVSLLAAAAVSTAVDTSTSTSRDEHSKAALEAAEAGVSAATYRLDVLSPASTQCVGAGVEAPSEGYCAVREAVSLGNGATFTYYTSAALKAPERCAGRELSGSAAGELIQRCVTAVGEVNGVKARLQARVATIAPNSKLFKVAGFLGLEEVYVSGDQHVVGVAASNGKIVGTGSAAFEKGYELGPSGTFTPAAGKERNRTGVTVCGKGKEEAVPTCETKLSEPLAAPLPTNHATETLNNDTRLEESRDEKHVTGRSGYTYTGLEQDEIFENREKAVTYSPLTHELALESSGRVTLAGERYYLCNFTGTNSSKLQIASWAKVEVFIDSPEDPNGKCPKGSGKFEVSGAFLLENLSGKAGALLIVMYGKGPLKVEGGGTMQASIYAPEAEVVVDGGGKFTGAIVARKLHLENGSNEPIAEWSSEAGEIKIGNPGLSAYYRTAWTQCTPEGSSPSVGC